jgi:hypothetical protein
VTLLEELESCGLVLTAEGNAIRLRGPRSAVTNDVRRAVRKHKDELVEALFDREERAALQGCPEWMDARKWARVTGHPAVRRLTELGLVYEIVGVETAGQREAAA